MVLAAGRGERMRPLTDTCPKPLLVVRGKPLMLWPMQALSRGGFGRQLVNTAWLGEQIEHQIGLESNKGGHSALQKQEQFTVAYSHEGRDFGGALETAGGIVRALPQLADGFWVVAGDVFAPDFRFTREALDRFMASGKLGHLWLVPNPAHNPRGDFGISPEGLALNQARQTYTFSTIALYRRALFAPPYCDIPPGNPQGLKAPLAPLLRAAMDNQQITAELYTGPWTDVGTPERLAQLNTP
ncbi:MAG: nucleotidyltransferase family protein [Ramlibacter sp.]|nr:nucleotidyltransferase family protein [Ramlibacter sp.]